MIGWSRLCSCLSGSLLCGWAHHRTVHTLAFDCADMSEAVTTVAAIHLILWSSSNIEQVPASPKNVHIIWWKIQQPKCVQKEAPFNPVRDPHSQVRQYFRICECCTVLDSDSRKDPQLSSPIVSAIATLLLWFRTRLLADCEMMVS